MDRTLFFVADASQEPEGTASAEYAENAEYTAISRGAVNWRKRRASWKNSASARSGWEAVRPYATPSR
ncbi:hypothetical protein SMA5143A_6934 [Streptomyces sp. MA5143a]|nr:hypothetical protein SMA5143A_6934 [Streptomyces sp. MA5143a]